VPREEPLSNIADRFFSNYEIEADKRLSCRRSVLGVILLDIIQL
jgi:hypothetical protein